MDEFKNVAEHVAFAAEKMKKVNLFTTERMFCDVYCFEPGQEQTPHAHVGSDKVYYVLQGSGQVRVGEETKELGPGDIALAAVLWFPQSGLPSWCVGMRGLVRGGFTLFCCLRT